MTQLLQTVSDLCQEHGVSRQTIDVRIKAGKIRQPDLVLEGKPLWFSDELRTLLSGSALAQAKQERDHKAATTMPLPEILPQTLGYLPAARFGGAK